jgi:hypothetical protein
MTIREIIRQGFYYARTCRWLWLFGFFVGVASGGSSGGGGGGDGGWSIGAGGIAVDAGSLRVAEIAPLAIGIVLAVAAVTIMRFVGEGALIEGIVRARQGASITAREGFRAGWAHWSVLLRIALLYLAATIASVALLVAPCVIAVQSLGPVGGVLFGIPALFVAVPWLVTLYLVQAFAWRIAVVENRSALDAIAKARLFLHGRLIHGLKLLVAMFVGSLGIALLGVIVIAPVVLLLVGLIPLLHVFPVIVVGGFLLLPPIYMLTALLGTFRSSIWTIGYLTQVGS